MGLTSAAETAIAQCVRLKAGEKCLIVTDDERLEIAEALEAAARDHARDTCLIRYPPGTEHGTEPPAPVAAAMRESDVFLAPTSKSLSHTRARSRACEHGARGATLPGITYDVFVTGLAADYTAIRDACERVYAAVHDAETVRVTAPAGTDITFEIGEREWLCDTGLVHEPGDFSNLPAGEVFVSPTSANGTYVVDGSIRPYGLLDSGHTVRVTVEDGYATAIDDEQVDEMFTRAAATGGNAVYNLAELGIGTNGAVTDLIGSILLDEKAGGTIHIALGDDASIGGDTEAPIHADGVIRDPTVFADGEEIALPGA